MRHAAWCTARCTLFRDVADRLLNWIEVTDWIELDLRTGFVHIHWFIYLLIYIFINLYIYLFIYLWPFVGDGSRGPALRQQFNSTILLSLAIQFNSTIQFNLQWERHVDAPRRVVYRTLYIVPSSCRPSIELNWSDGLNWVESSNWICSHLYI